MSEEVFERIIKRKTRQHQSEAFKFFWASLVLQIIAYSLLTHVTIKYWGDTTTIVSILGILLYIPFTIVFMKKFKRMAIAQGPVSLFVTQQLESLESFYRFKKRYELVLIPIMTLIGTFITFQIWLPSISLEGFVITFLIALASCIIAIREENKKSFDIPLSKLRLILEDLNAN